MSEPDDFFVDKDGNRFVYVNDDIGYLREPPEFEESRLYYESVELELSMIEDVQTSNMPEPTHSYCIFCINIAQLEQLLNVFYDSVAILCTKPNPMATMREATAKEKRAWTRNNKSQVFKDLTLGQKYSALLLVEFITEEDQEKYKDITRALDELVGDRNRITHSLFDPKTSTKQKIAMINRANKNIKFIKKEIEQLDSVFSFYLLQHAYLYWK